MCVLCLNCVLQTELAFPSLPAVNEVALAAVPFKATELASPDFEMALATECPVLDLEWAFAVPFVELLEPPTSSSGVGVSASAAGASAGALSCSTKQ